MCFSQAALVLLCQGKGSRHGPELCLPGVVRSSVDEFPLPAPSLCLGLSHSLSRHTWVQRAASQESERQPRGGGGNTAPVQGPLATGSTHTCLWLFPQRQNRLCQKSGTFRDFTLSRWSRVTPDLDTSGVTPWLLLQTGLVTSNRGRTSSLGVTQVRPTAPKLLVHCQVGVMVSLESHVSLKHVGSVNL